LTPRGAKVLAAITLGLALAVVGYFVFRRYFSTLPLVAAAAAGCVTFLLVRPKEPGPGPEPLLERRQWVKILSALFFFASAASLALMVSAQYTKPIGYYVAISVAAGAIAGIAFLVNTNREVLAALGMVVLLALNVYGTNALAFPLGIGGADAPTHLYFLVRPIVETGAVEQGNLCGLIYGAFPAHHILVALSAILMPGVPALTYYGLGAVIMVLPVLVVFAIGQRLFGPRTGLLAALLLAGASYYISWASHAAPLTYAIPLIAVLVLVLARSLERFRFRWLGVAAILGLAVVLTHPYSSVILGLVLLSIVLGQAIFRPERRLTVGALPAAGAVYAFLLLFDWVNFSCLMTKSFQLTLGWVNAFTGEALQAPPAVYDVLPLSAIFANTAGDVLLLLLAVVGFFVILSRRLVPADLIVLAPMVGLLVISGIGIVTTLAYLLPNRIYVYLQFLALAPLAAVGLERVLRRPKPSDRGPTRARTLAIAAAVVAAFVFASAVSTIAGFETSPLTAGRPFVKLYDTEFEERSAAWVCEFAWAPTRVETALSFHSLPRLGMRDCLTSFNTTVEKMRLTENATIDFHESKPGSRILFSEYDFSPGFQATVTGAGQFGRGVYDRLLAEDLERLDAFPRLYDNGVVVAFGVESPARSGPADARSFLWDSGARRWGESGCGFTSAIDRGTSTSRSRTRWARRSSSSSSARAIPSRSSSCSPCPDTSSPRPCSRGHRTSTGSSGSP